jgi:hypothetical protein
MHSVQAKPAEPAYAPRDSAGDTGGLAGMTALSRLARSIFKRPYSFRQR